MHCNCMTKGCPNRAVEFRPRCAACYERLPEYDWSYRCRIPNHEGAVRAYIEDGGPLGDFLESVFANDFVGVIGRADARDEQLLRDWMLFVYNDSPSACWGSVAIVRGWQEAGGLAGMTLDHEGDEGRQLYYALNRQHREARRR